MGNTENEKRAFSNPPAPSLKEGTDKKKNPPVSNSYTKLRYLLIVENVMIALAFSLFIVVYFNFVHLGYVFNLFILFLLLLGVGLFISGLVIFSKIVKILSRKDLPVYQNFLDDENVVLDLDGLKVDLDVDSLALRLYPEVQVNVFKRSKSGTMSDLNKSIFRIFICVLD